MDAKAEAEAISQMNRGDPRDIIRLLEYEIRHLKRQARRSGCKGCTASSYKTKIAFIEQKIRFIKGRKEFRGMNL